MRGRAREVGLEQVDGRQHRRHQRAQVGEELGQRVLGHAVPMIHTGELEPERSVTLLRQQTV